MIDDIRIPVDGGELSVALFGPTDAPPVLAIHGITASSRAWLAMARHLPDIRLVAPDLRGRGRSRDLPPSAGLRQHATDLELVLESLGVDHLPVVGHSMGGFVAVALAASRPDAVTELVLIDGGLPLERPVGVTDSDLPGAVLGPAAERLQRTFPSAEAYREFWRRHPAFAGAWTDDVAAYVDDDLVGEAPDLRSASSVEAIAADALDLYGDPWYLDALAGLLPPVTLFRAPRGLLDEPGGLYPSERLAAAADAVPGIRVVEVPDVNHYTILMTDPGASILASAVHGAVHPTSPRSA